MSRYLLIVVIIISAIAMLPGWSDPTPPILPKIQETPLPPAIELTAPAITPEDVPNRPLTADEAARIALHHQPSIAIATQGVVAAQGNTQAVRSGLFPNLNANSGYSNNVGAANAAAGAPGIGYQTSVVMRQLLFDFNHTRDVVKQAEAQERSANANLTRAQSDLVYQVKQAFYQYAQNQQLVAVNEANLRNQQTHLEQAQARVKAGLGLPSDVVRAQTAVSDAIFALNVARNTASISRVNLAFLMGIDPRTPIKAAESNEPPANTDDLNGLIKQALAQRPEIAQSQANIQANRAAVDAARSSNAPALVGAVGYYNRGTDIPAPNSAAAYTLGISWDLFDSGLTAGHVKQAKANLASSQAALDATSLSVVSDVSQAYVNLRTAEQRVTTADAEVANAQESVRLTQGRYQAGLGTFLDVLDAQTALLTAQTNRVNAETAVDQARAALAHATGMPLSPAR